MSEQHEALIRRWFDEVWNQRRGEAIDEMMADEVEAFGLPAPTHGREAFKQFHQAFLAGFTALYVTVEEVISEGDRAAYRCRLKATHRNGRTAEVDGAGFVRIRDGQLTAGHNIWNFHELLEQLGAISRNSVMNAVRPGDPAA
jgi:ketosteroid isomerase-like protein